MLYQRGRIWWFEFHYCGRRIAKSTKETNRNRAAEAERQYRNRLNDSYNKTPERVVPVTFKEAAERQIKRKVAIRNLPPKSEQRERGTLKHLLPVFGSMLLTDITADAINDYVSDRLAAGAAAKTVVSEVGALRFVLRKHRLWENLRPDVELPPIKNEIGRALSFQEESALLKECVASRSRALFAAIVLALSTGLRRDELRVLRWQQINFVARILRVGKAKTEAGTNREVPLNDRAIAALQQWAANFPKRHRDHFLFPAEKYGQSGAVYSSDVLTPINSWKEAWEAAKKRAGLQCRWHDLRHTAVTRLLESGVPISVVASIMGWSGSTMILMSRRYGHISSAVKAEAMQQLNRAASGFELLQNSLQSADEPESKIQ